MKMHVSLVRIVVGLNMNLVLNEPHAILTAQRVVYEVETPIVFAMTWSAPAVIASTVMQPALLAMLHQMHKVQDHAPARKITDEPMQILKHVLLASLIAELVPHIPRMKTVPHVAQLLLNVITRVDLQLVTATEQPLVQLGLPLQLQEKIVLHLLKLLSPYTRGINHPLLLLL